MKNFVTYGEVLKQQQARLTTFPTRVLKADLTAEEKIMVISFFHLMSQQDYLNGTEMISAMQLADTLDISEDEAREVFESLMKKGVILKDGKDYQLHI